jgi:hypothetical protein
MSNDWYEIDPEEYNRGYAQGRNEVKVLRDAGYTWDQFHLLNAHHTPYDAGYCDGYNRAVETKLKNTLC